MRKVDPVALGHERLVNLSGVVRSMKTLALDPPVFLISQFLTPAEADGIVRAGTAKGLGKSQVAHPSANGISLPPHHAQFKGAFSRHDQNRDGALDSDELAVFLSDEMDMPNHAGEWDTFLQRYSFTGSKVSFKTFKTKGIDLGKYVTWLTNSSLTCGSGTATRHGYTMTLPLPVSSKNVPLPSLYCPLGLSNLLKTCRCLGTALGATTHVTMIAPLTFWKKAKVCVWRQLHCFSTNLRAVAKSRFLQLIIPSLRATVRKNGQTWSHDVSQPHSAFKWVVWL